MHILTLPQKSSNSGSIHDIRSERFDIDIKFIGDTQYAVVKASYYNDFSYTTHKTFDAAIAASQKLKKQGYSHQIINRNGEFKCR